MIVVKKSNIPNNFIGKSIGEVGEWYCFPDEFASELKGIDVRCVPDDIKFPLAFRQPGEGNREGWLSSFDVIFTPLAAFMMLPFSKMFIFLIGEIKGLKRKYSKSAFLFFKSISFKKLSIDSSIFFLLLFSDNKALAYLLQSSSKFKFFLDN